jgi:hypothetical protein
MHFTLEVSHRNDCVLGKRVKKLMPPIRREVGSRRVFLCKAHAITVVETQALYGKSVRSLVEIESWVANKLTSVVNKAVV